jgi:hypothetical protein
MVYDEKMDQPILEILRSYYPDLTEKELEICRQVTISMWDLHDVQKDIANGQL